MTSGSVPQPSAGRFGDTTDRDYVAKLTRFFDYAEPEIRLLMDEVDCPADALVLDVGCGPGRTTRLLDARGWRSVGLDVSRPHLAAARVGGSAPLLVCGDVAALPVRPRTFHAVWAANTVNHLPDPAAAIEALMRLLVPGGRLYLVQSSLLPDMLFAWDEHFERSLTDACRSFYREKYGLQPRDTAPNRRLVGWAIDAGYPARRVHTVVVERVQPLRPADRAYFRHAVLEGVWGEAVAHRLDATDRVTWRRYCDPESPEYGLDRPDFHSLQTLTLLELAADPEPTRNV